MTDERRIAACLQACQSLSTEALEAFNAAKVDHTEPRLVVYVLGWGEAGLAVYTSHDAAHKRARELGDQLAGQGKVWLRRCEVRS